MSGIVGSKLNHRGSGLIGDVGADGQHLLSAGVGMKHEFESVSVPAAYDDEPIRSDLTALAIREATNEASAAFNLPNSFIETFTDDTNLGTQTDCDRVSGYMTTNTKEANTLALWTFPDADTTVEDSTGNTYVDDVGKLAAQELGDHGQEIITDGAFAGYRAFETGGWTYTDQDRGIEVVLVGGQTHPLDFGTGAFTIEFFAKDATGTPPQSQCSFSMDDGTTNHISMGSWAAGTTWISNYVDGSAYAASSSYTSVHTQDWKHIAYVRDASGNHAVWVNGGIASGVGNASAVSPNSGNGYYDKSTAGANQDDMDYTGGSAKVRWGTRSSSQETGHTAFSMIRYSDIARYDPTGTSITVPTAAFDAGSTSATGTLIQSANTVAASKTVVGGTMLYADAAGTATIGTDLKIYFSCNNGGAWTEAASYTAITPVYASGIKQVRLGETTCTAGTGVVYKAVWANQSGSLETRLHGIGTTY